MQIFRINVVVDLTQPLKRGFFAMKEQREKCWYRVTYERLPMFCLLCGILGHGQAQCLTRYEDDFVEPDEGMPFRNWLRATGDSMQDRDAPLPLQAVDSKLVRHQQVPTEPKRYGATLGVGK